ncbi:MAG: hypothetical protein LBS86_03640 [Treponema sp.]|jgi:hypothetical protein|nr:hypothetical protein [Treponema sp.]
MKSVKKLSVLIAACMTALACSTPAPAPEPAPAPAPKTERELAAERLAPIRTTPAQRPEWVDVMPKTEDSLSFTGMSNRYATEALARNAALDDGRRQLVDYYGTEMVNKAIAKTASAGTLGNTVQPAEVAQGLQARISQNAAQALEARAFYVEVYLDDSGKEAFIAHVWMEIHSNIIRRVIDDYTNEQAVGLRAKAAAEPDADVRRQFELAAEMMENGLSDELVQ